MESKLEFLNDLRIKYPEDYRSILDADIKDGRIRVLTVGVCAGQEMDRILPEILDAKVKICLGYHLHTTLKSWDGMHEKSN